ncbi:HRDC domain-containing protein [Paenibacillus methanolicus]|uniref:HRDC domain-containing protein n=1 Tax=Paenibacillus methanolicus TaxID=582686 RepID=A0A5S5BTZ0_9BACL|nr:HRDC domain-containing protein [Paenibacillus methanolicus]TYP69808.1 HRDC domain-containing protein [Paenibacillus methanolicus]
MQVVFMNTFEKSSELAQGEQAQLSICEQQGSWSVLWSGDAAAGEGQSVWFEGSSWEEMIASFRHGVAVKMGEGYVPVIDGMLEERKPLAAATSAYAMLQCYGETNANASLFDALRDWRRAKAAAEKKSAYMVANNRMLLMISAYVPHLPEELAQIPGWGDAKLAAYGEDILKITAAFEQSHPFPLDWVTEALDPKLFTSWIYKQKENKYKAMLDRQTEKKRLLAAIAEGKSIVQMQTVLEMPRRDLMEKIERLELEGYDLEPFIERELADMPSVEQEQVWEAMTIIGDRYLKPVLHQVYGEELPSGQPVDMLYDRLRLIRLRFRRHDKADAV